jgi:Fic family protein
MNFEKLNARFNDVPVVRGANVFTTAEYSAATGGLNARTARERLQKLQAEGLVQKVRTRRNGKVVPAWEYISRKRKVVSE